MMSSMQEQSDNYPQGRTTTIKSRRSSASGSSRPRRGSKGTLHRSSGKVQSGALRQSARNKSKGGSMVVQEHPIADQLRKKSSEAAISRSIEQLSLSKVSSKQVLNGKVPSTALLSNPINNDLINVKVDRSTPEHLDGSRNWRASDQGEPFFFSNQSGQTKSRPISGNRFALSQERLNGEPCSRLATSFNNGVPKWRRMWEPLSISKVEVQVEDS